MPGIRRMGNIMNDLGLAAGQRVEVKLTELTVVTLPSAANSRTLEVKDDEGRVWFFPDDVEHVEINRVLPKGWEPQVGDLWTVSGEDMDYFIRSTDGGIFAVPPSSEYFHYSLHRPSDRAQFLAVNPVLVRRRER
jgi:hypothetical protein